MILLKVNCSSLFEKVRSLHSIPNKSFDPMNSRSYIKSGEFLLSGSILLSPKQNYYLFLQNDGNLVLINSSNKSPVWASNTSHKGLGPYRLALVNTGVLVIFDRFNGMIWATATNKSGNGDYRLDVLDSGKLQISSKTSNLPLWTSMRMETKKILKQNYQNTLTTGQKFIVGESLMSQNGNYNATLLANGNFVLYKTEVSTSMKYNSDTSSFEIIPNVTQIWTSDTANVSSNTVYLVVKKYGYLAIYDSVTRRRIWTSNSKRYAKDVYSLVLLDSGVLSLTNSKGVTFWNILGYNLDGPSQMPITSNYVPVVSKNYTPIVSNNYTPVVSNNQIHGLQPGQSIGDGDSLSANKYTLKLKTNGNLVLSYTPSSESKITLWESNTQNTGIAPFRLIMRKDGNLVIIDSTNSEIWSSNTNSASSSLELNENGNLIIRTTFNRKVFELFNTEENNLSSIVSSFPINENFLRSVIYTNQNLLTGSYLVSQNQKYMAYLKSDGDLTITNFSLSPANMTVLWKSNIINRGTSPYTLRIENDGSLRQYDVDSKQVWKTGSTGQIKSNNYYLLMDNDGILKIFNTKSLAKSYNISYIKAKKNFSQQIILDASNLISGNILKNGYSLSSENKKYTFDLKLNGTVTVTYYPNTTTNRNNNRTVWSSPTVSIGTGPFKLNITSIGNLEVRDKDRVLIWQSGSIRSAKDNNVFSLIITNSGNAIVLDTQFNPVWDIKKGVYQSSGPAFSVNTNSTAQITAPPMPFAPPIMPKITQAPKKAEDSKIPLPPMPKSPKVPKAPGAPKKQKPKKKPNNNSNKKPKAPKKNPLTPKKPFKNNINPEIKTLKEAEFMTNLQTLLSANGKYKLTITPNGNIVITKTKSSKAVWSSNSSQKKVSTYKLILLKTGNLVLINTKDKILWQSNSVGAPKKNYNVLLNNNGVLTIFKHGNKLVWDSALKAQKFKQNIMTNQLTEGLYIKSGQSLYSKNSNFKLDLGVDGNIVINNKAGKQVWTSNTKNKGTGPYSLLMKTNGNLVLIDKKKVVIWSTKTRGKLNKNYKVKLQENGTLTVLKGKKLLWDNVKGLYEKPVHLKKEATPKPKPVQKKVVLPPTLPKHIDVGTSTLTQKNKLNENEALFSQNQKYSLELRDDGVLSLYNYPDSISNINNKVLIWSSNTKTKHKGPYKLIVSKKGVLKIEGKKKTVWTNKYKNLSYGEFIAKIENDGNLNVYKVKKGKYKLVWDAMGISKKKLKKFKKQKKVKSTLYVNQSFKSEETLYSQNMKYAVELLTDGNLVVFNYPKGIHIDSKNRTVFWSSNSQQREKDGPFKLKISRYGLLEIYNKKKEAIWFSNTKQKKSSSKFYLTISKDGNLMLKDKNSKTIWDSMGKYTSPSVKFLTNSLNAGQNIKVGSSLYSNNKRFSLDVQYDGNLVIYNYPSGYSNNSNRKPIWWTINKVKDVSQPNFKLKLTRQGQLVLSDQNKKVIWTTNAKISKKDKKNTKFTAVLTDKGVLKIKNKAGVTLWSS